MYCLPEHVLPLLECPGLENIYKQTLFLHASPAARNFFVSPSSCKHFFLLAYNLFQNFPYLSVLVIVHFRISSIGLFVNLLTIVTFSFFFFSDIWIVVYFSQRLVILYYIRRIMPSLFGRLKITFPFLDLLESAGHYCGHPSWTVYCYSFHNLLFLGLLKNNDLKLGVRWLF